MKSLLMALFIFWQVCLQSAYAEEGWQPIKEQSLEVVESSILDFSNFTANKPAGTSGWVLPSYDGHLQFEQAPVQQRFLCASLVLSSPNGGIPAKPESDRMVVQLKRTGYNLVRLHFIDAILTSGRSGDFDFDAEQFDRLQYLLASLKKSGIYWIVDAMTSENGGYGNVKPNPWVNRHDLKMKLYYDPAAMDHWRRLVSTIWARNNPYTGIPPLRDPAMLGIILVNENSLAYLATLKGQYPPELENRFGEWLAAKYPSESALKNAWGLDVSVNDKYGVTAAVPNVIRDKSARGRDFSQFVANRERSLFREMDGYVRTLGFRGMTTAYNNWGFFHADVARSEAAWIDMHSYQSLPSMFADQSSSVPQKSIFDDAGQYGRELTNARQWGKPFTVTEYGQPFWNQWRHETTAWIPALAAFQGFDAICQFAEMPVLNGYNDSTALRRRAMYPFGIGGDPVTRAGERLAALLYLRGDVSTSRKRVYLHLDPARTFREGESWGQVPENLSRLSFVTATGLAFNSVPADVTGGQELHIALGAGSDGLAEKLKALALNKGVLIGNDPVSLLRESGIITSSNQTQISTGLFETENGEMLFDTSGKKLLVKTDKTVVFTQRNGAAQANGVELSLLSGPATVAVSSMDGRNLNETGRILIMVLTDALNTGMEFSDGDHTTLRKLGQFPPVVRTVTAQMAIHNINANSLKVWAIDQTGKRVAQVSAKNDKGELRFTINNNIPEYGPVMYFEITDR